MTVQPRRGFGRYVKVLGIFPSSFLKFKIARPQKMFTVFRPVSVVIRGKGSFLVWNILYDEVIYIHSASEMKDVLFLLLIADY